MATNNSINTPLITPVTRGGTGLATVTQHGVLTGNAAGSLVPLAAATNGQLLIGNTGNAPSLAVPTSTGATIAITTSAGGLNFEAVSAGQLPYVDVTGTTQAMAVNTSYGADNAALVTLTLPATAAAGSQIEVIWVGAGGWLIAQNAGQSIILGTSTTTVGVAGSLASFEQGDSVTLKCTTTNTGWIAYANQGNITVV